ncbi:putative serpin-Z8 [Lolium perenne]|uniref:putative serpin-Z8 n=1 Tax=Lolium perenne TaxID=4522 RepID=UPI0021EA440F|nr:putative serpin-Z8 [Lolium perenne]
MEATRNPMAQADLVGLAALSAGLARSLAEENAENNLVFSPLSIYAALALVAAGARGSTLDEILGVVGARSRGQLEEIVARVTADALKDQSDSGGPRVAFACGIWSELTRPLKPAFLEVVAGTYKAEASTVDFINNPEEARSQINAWVAHATSNLIGSIFGPRSITPLTRVVLGNAIYFKGKWERPFDKKRTTNKLFYRLDGGTVDDVPFMKSRSSQFIAVHDGFKVLKLRYQMAQAQGYAKESSDRNKRTKVSSDKPTQFSMCIFLPDARDGLPNLVDMIASQPDFLHEHLPKKKVEVDEFRVPKFKLSFENSVVTILKKLGLQLPFSDQADLSDMVEPDESGLPLVLSDVFHKAIIEVNEEGTEAAAVTMMSIRIGCSMRPRPPPPQVDFVADHPFAYFIVEETTGAVVFAGHVLDPSREN